MANRFNSPIASGAISTYAPVRFDVYQNELNMVQKRWDENEAFSDELNKTINALPAMPGDVPYRDKLVSSLTTKLSDLVSKTTDLGSPSFKREAETIYNQFSKDANVKTLVSNSAQYTKRSKLIEDLNKDNRYRPELDVNNEKTRVDQNGNVIPFVSNVERSYSDPEYSAGFEKFMNQVKANAQAGKGYAFDPEGNKINFEFSSEGISPQQIKSLTEQYGSSFLRTDVGKQRLRIYTARTGDPEIAKAMVYDDIYSYGVGNVYSKTSKGEDFSYAPESVLKRREEAQKQYMNPQGMYMETPGYETENPVLTEDSPEIQEAIRSLAKQRGVPEKDIDKKGLAKAMNDLRNGYAASGVIMPTKEKEFKAVEKKLFGPDRKDVTFLTGETLVKKGDKLVIMDNEERDNLEKNYNFSFKGIDVNNQKASGAVVIQASPKDGSEGKQITLYLPNSAVTDDNSAYAKQMLTTLNNANLKPFFSTPINGYIPGSNGKLIPLPPNSELNVITEVTRTGNKITGAKQKMQIVGDEMGPNGKMVRREVPLADGVLKQYYATLMMNSFVGNTEEE